MATTASDEIAGHGVSRVLLMIRALLITFGGSLILLAGAVTAVATTASSALRGEMPAAWAAVGTLVVLAYAFLARPWMARRHQVEIDAPPAAVWPWIAQIGQDRAGFYSYRWLENLAGCEMPDAKEIHPEWQRREVGEVVPLHPLNGLRVTRFEPGHLIELEGWGSFEAQSLGDGRTRLRVVSPKAHGLAAVFYTLMLELPHYVMERKMLVEIRRLATRASDADRTACVSCAIAGCGRGV